MSAVDHAAAPAALDVFRCPLRGVQLVEASAGTGKTWNLAALVLRLVVEHGLGIDRVLVVTFTKAATAELRERIRARVVEVLSAVRRGVVPGGDPFVRDLLQALHARGLDDATIERRLAVAVQDFDQAAVFTIHSFCQRALADAPFAAGVPLALEALTDDSALRREVVEDFWRRRIAGGAISPALADHLLGAKAKTTPETLSAELKRALAQPFAEWRWPDGLDAATGDAPAVDEFAACHAALRALWRDERERIVGPIRAARDAGHLPGNVYREGTVEQAIDAWDEALGLPVAPTGRKLSDRLPFLTALKLKTKQKCPPLPAHPFHAAAADWLAAHERCARSLELQRLALVRDLLREGPEDLRRRKQAARVVAFDDMLANLHARLTDGAHPELAASLRERFPAALIDEFQDTDPLQWSIFSTLYAGTGAPLFLVGDPKQAIYGFRQADLPTYLAARASADATHTLAANQRSARPLIDAVNTLFAANPRAFMVEGLPFHPVAVGEKARKPFVDTSGEPRAALQLWTLPPAATPDGAPAPLPKAEAKQVAAEACAAEIARLLRGARAGRVLHDGRALAAGEIAVLVRTHGEGAMVRRALAALGIGSVELSQASVFASPEAEELERLLAAVLEPGREPLLRAALATEAMGRDAAEIAALGEDEPASLALAARFADHRDAWVERGVGLMLRQLLRAEGIVARLLARPDGERRLTNWLHLAELLHEAQADHATPEALLAWLAGQRREPRQDEAAQLRLESDQALVQIVTIHRAKGLEYPVVFCPFVFDDGLGPRRQMLLGCQWRDEHGRVVIDLRDDETVRRAAVEQARAERAAEHLRLLYVALTRAVHRCHLVVGAYLCRGKTTEAGQSLLAWLASGTGVTPEAWLGGTRDAGRIEADWSAFASQAAATTHGAIGLAPLPAGPGVPLTPLPLAPDAIAACPPPARIPPAWSIGSYSSLAHGTAAAVVERGAADHDARAAGVDAATGLAPVDAATIGLDEGFAALPRAAVPADDILRFPRGPAAGDCLHALLERVDFADDAGWDHAIDAVLAAHAPVVVAARAVAGRAARSARSEAARGEPGDDGAGDHVVGARDGIDTADVAIHHDDDAPPLAPMLRTMLRDLTATRLPTGWSLAELDPRRRLVELEFSLPAARVPAGALAALLRRHGYPLPPAGVGALDGFLRGYIDLVVAHGDRLHVIDWKSNHLGESPRDHAPSRTAAAMAANGYHLQLLLYTLALHRHLRARLPGYDYDRHMGEAMYLFVRGVRPQWTAADGRAAGVYAHRPARAVVEALDALFDARELA